MYRLLIVFLLVSYSGLSQPGKVSAGIVAFAQESYDDALEDLTTALEHPELLKERQLYKAWLYKGKALFELYQNALRSKEASLISKHQNNLLEAYDCFQNAYKYSSDERERQQIDVAVENVIVPSLNMGIVELNNGNFKAAQRYLNNCKEADQHVTFSESYLFYAVSGQCLVSLGDSTLALADLNKAISLYTEDRPAFPNFLIGHSYYRAAMLVRYHNQDVDEALRIIQHGIELLDSEEERRKQLIRNSTSASDKNQLEQLQQAYSRVSADLKGFELDIYLNSPDKYEEALLKFEKATEANPEDQTLLIAYGNLAEATDLDKGYELYKKVLEINPENMTALYNAGANRVNKGVYFAKLSNEEIDFTRANEWREKTDAAFTMALPHFEKYHQANPEDQFALGALLQITLQLEMMDAYKGYKAKKDALRGY